MPLKDILQKDPIITTISVQALWENPAICEERYGRHYATYVSIPEVRDRWDRALSRLIEGKPLLGAIYAPYGYGKTGAAIELWAVAEKAGIVATPPFMCTKVSDILEASHAWVAYKVKHRRPELLGTLEELFQGAKTRSIEELVRQLAQDLDVPESAARDILRTLQRQGSLRLDDSPSKVLKYLSEATDLVLAAGFKGLMVIPDEFKLFTGSSSDTDANISRLTELVWGIRDETRPVGLVFFMPEYTHSIIQNKSGDVAQRLGSHQVTLNLLGVYDASFPRMLWKQLSNVLKLTPEEQNCLSEDVLVALGQFCSRTDIFNGPRSVVSVFRRAAAKYQYSGELYDIFDFVKDYTSGQVVFDGKETATREAFLALLNLHKDEGSQTERAISLLAAFPDGCPEEVAARHGLTEQLEDLTRRHLGDHIITQALGPTLRVYKIGEPTDKVTEALKLFRNYYNPQDASIRRAALRGFWNFVLPKIIRQRHGAETLGWTGYSEWAEGDRLSNFREICIYGGPCKEHPFRKVKLRVTCDEQFWSVDTEDVHLGIAILLDAADGSAHDVRYPSSKACLIRLALSRPIDTRQIPGDIAKLRDIFLPRDVTPLLLLSLADFLDRNLLRSEAIGEQDRRVGQFLVETSITQRVIREVFSEELRSASGYPNLPIGEAFVEQFLAEIFSKMFPHYVTLKAVPQQALQKYIQALESSAEPVLSLAQKRGFVEISDKKGRIANKFGYASHATFREAVKSYWSSLMELLDWQGSKEESAASIRLKLHPLESVILEELRSSQYTTLVEGQRVKAVTVSQLYNRVTELGYLEEEIEHGIRLLIARGYCVQTDIKGQRVLCEAPRQQTAFELWQTYENFAEQLKMICEFDRVEAREILGNIRWDIASELKQLIDDEKADKDVEIQLDEMQHQVTLLKEALRQYLARRIVDTAKNIHGLLQLCKQARNRVLPAVLNPDKTSIPPTDFSSLLQDLQVQLRNRYQRQYSNYEALQGELEDALSEYEKGKSGGDWIQLFKSLKERVERANGTMELLERNWKELEQLAASYARWLDVAGEVSRLRLQLLQQKDSVPAVVTLLEELTEDISFRIREHLASRKLDGLRDWEIFTHRVEALRNRWEQAAQERHRAFNAELEDYRRLLEAAGISKVTLDVPYDDLDPNRSRMLLWQAVRKYLEEVQARATQYLDEMRNELLKARKIYRLEHADEVTQLESEWMDLNHNLLKVFEELSDDVVSNRERIEHWLGRLKPFTEPEGLIAQLYDRIEKLIHSTAKVPLDPSEEEVLNIIAKHEGNLTETIVELLQENSPYHRLEDVLSVVIALYRKGRVNLEAKIITREW